MKNYPYKVRHNNISNLSYGLFFVALSACGGSRSYDDDKKEKENNSKTKYLSYSETPYVDTNSVVIEKKFLSSNPTTITLIVYGKIDEKEVSDEQAITLTSSVKITSLAIGDNGKPVQVPTKGLVIYKVNDTVMYEGVTPSLPYDYDGKDAKLTITVASGKSNSIYQIKIKGQKQIIATGQIKEKSATSLADKETEKEHIKIYANLDKKDQKWVISDIKYQTFKDELTLVNVFMKDGSSGNHQDWHLNIKEEQITLTPKDLKLMNFFIDYLVLRDDQSLLSIYPSDDDQTKHYDTPDEIEYIAVEYQGSDLS